MANIVKANTGTDLNDGASWVGGVAPGAGDIAVFDSTITTFNTYNLTANTTWGGIRVTNPGSTFIDIEGVATLTLATSGIDSSTATKNISIGANVSVILASSQTIAAGSASVEISGPFSVVNPATMTLTVTGGTFFQQGNATLGPITCTANGKFTKGGGSLNGGTYPYAITLSGANSEFFFNHGAAPLVHTLTGTISGIGKVRIGASPSRTLVIANAAANTYSGGTDLGNGLTGTVSADTDTAFGTGDVNWQSGTLTSNAARTLANTLTFLTSGTRTFAGAFDFRFSGGATVTGATTTLVCNGSAVFTVNTITYTGRLTKNGPGKLQLGTGSGAGGFDMAAGEVWVAGGTVFGTGTVAVIGGTFVAIGSAGTNRIIANNLTGTGTFRKSGTAIIRLSGDNSGFSGAIELLQAVLAIDNILATSVNNDVSLLASGVSFAIGPAFAGPGSGLTCNIRSLDGVAGSVITPNFDAATGTRALWIHQQTDKTFAGTIQAGTGGRVLHVRKRGAAKLTLTNANAPTILIVDTGALKAQATQALGAAGSLFSSFATGEVQIATAVLGGKYTFKGSWNNLGGQFTIGG